MLLGISGFQKRSRTCGTELKAASWSGENRKRWQHVIPPLIIPALVDLDRTKHHSEGGTDPEGGT